MKGEKERKLKISTNLLLEDSLSKICFTTLNVVKSALKLLLAFLF